MKQVSGFRSCLSTRFHNYGDVFRDGDPCPISEIRRHIWPQRQKDTETKHVAPDAAPRSSGRGVATAKTNDHWAVARSVVCGLRASRLGLRCRPTASSASVSQCLRGLSKSIRRRHYEMLYLASAAERPPPSMACSTSDATRRCRTTAGLAARRESPFAYAAAAGPAMRRFRPDPRAPRYGAGTRPAAAWR